jgi:hypothetical protein
MYGFLTFLVVVCRFTPVVDRRWRLYKHGTLGTYFAHRLADETAAAVDSNFGFDKKLTAREEAKEMLKIATTLVGDVANEWRGKATTKVQMGAILGAMTKDRKHSLSDKDHQEVANLASANHKASAKLVHKVRTELYWRTLNTLHVQLKHVTHFKHDASNARRDLRLWKSLGCKKVEMLNGFQRERLQVILTKSLNLVAQPFILALRSKSRTGTWKHVVKDRIMKNMSEKNLVLHADRDKAGTQGGAKNPVPVPPEG